MHDYPLSNAHAIDNCAYCAGYGNVPCSGPDVTGLDNASLAYFLSDVTCKSFSLTV